MTHYVAEIVVPVRAVQGVTVIREILNPRHIRNVIALALDEPAIVSYL